MSLSAANPGGWSLNEVLTSAQMTFLQNELLKAVDGVNGGTYTLTAPLQFAGADVRIAADLEVLSTGAVNVQSGGELNLLNGSTGTIDGDLTFAGNSDTLLQSSANLVAALGALIDVAGELRISSGGILNVNTGGRLDINTGAEMNIESTGFLDVQGTGGINILSGSFLRIKSSGDLRVEGGGDVVFEGTAGGGNALFQSGSHATFQGAAILKVENCESIVIDDAPEGFRTMLMPFGFVAGKWEPRFITEIVWEQVDATSDYRIVFPLPVHPGDDLINVFVGLNGENGHGGMPATKPVARIVRAALDGTYTTLATATDPAASLGVYEVLHYLVLQTGSLDSGAMPIVATDEPLYLIVHGEAGANAIAGLEIGSISGNVTARSYRTALAIYS